MNFKKWVKSIQPAGYNGARTVFEIESSFGCLKKYFKNIQTAGYNGAANGSWTTTQEILMLQ